MAGHSKWANIKHRKGRQDAIRGKLFTKAANEIIIAVKTGGGGDPDANSKLRLAVIKAKSVNMPNDNIKRAIDRGAAKDAAAMEEAVYEAYAPGGVAILIKVATDNKNRTLPQIKTIVSKAGGSMASQGSVAYLFQSKGLIVINAGVSDEETIMDLTLDAGAEDIVADDDGLIEIISEVESISDIVGVLEGADIAFKSAEPVMIAETKIALEGSAAEKIIKMVETIEDHDDVQTVFGNYDISDEELEKIYAE
jgi:YebC/PmpR family DNA-binding regulatory protein